MDNGLVHPIIVLIVYLVLLEMTLISPVYKPTIKSSLFYLKLFRILIGTFSVKVKVNSNSKLNPSLSKS